MGLPETEAWSGQQGTQWFQAPSIKKQESTTERGARVYGEVLSVTEAPEKAHTECEAGSLRNTLEHPRSLHA